MGGCALGRGHGFAARLDHGGCQTALGVRWELREVASGTNWRGLPETDDEVVVDNLHRGVEPRG